MGYLPHLRHDREHPDRLVLDAAQQATGVLVGLARAWREDPAGIDTLLGEIADLEDRSRAAVRGGAGLADSVHAVDQVAEQLLAEAGGAQFQLSIKRDRHAAHQARRIAEEARRMADALDLHANTITREVEDAEDRRTARREAELAQARALLAPLGRDITAAEQFAPSL
ncbi:hypothetical protein ACFWVC_26870 [Streptomyces sp. NPDC058691]|uniref:hypothetical protein n=1 Tax=Streptomyces sp. NPDC058691 TaxID=3346601 RepID=UPI003659AADE